MKISPVRSLRWFLVGGGIGLTVAILLSVIRPANPIIIVSLCPTSIVGLADPKSALEKAVIGSVIFGGNFLLYEALGAIAGLAAGEPSNDSGSSTTGGRQADTKGIRSQL
jgi:hypothetical protein